jgi:hypothetical protein
MVQKWIAELPQKTGRSLEDWLRLVKESGPPTEKERREWLKQKHHLGTNSAWWIAERAEGKGGEDSDPNAYLKAAERNVEKMFSGKKTALRMLYDQLLKLGFSIAKDVKDLPLPDYRPAVSQPCVCPDQTHHQHPH